MWLVLVGLINDSVMSAIDFSLNIWNDNTNNSIELHVDLEAKSYDSVIGLMDRADEFLSVNRMVLEPLNWR